ncbi:MAG: hypothetical protein IPL39_06145 [Opitutaceae bacterium]|nr:hypothetical protein [Opitutaceae bacterium]
MPTLEQGEPDHHSPAGDGGAAGADRVVQRQLFGGGKGERLDRAQLLLEIDTLEKLAARIEAPVQKVSYERSAPTKRPLASEAFAKLPVQETVVTLPEEVKAQPEACQEIGESAPSRSRSSRPSCSGARSCVQSSR